MKSHSHLNRLFEVAKTVPSEPIPDMPSSLATRILARSRPRPAEDPLGVLFPLFRRGFALATVIMVATIAWSYAHTTANADHEALANFTLRADMMP
jgi:hypothetical protein